MLLHLSGEITNFVLWNIDFNELKGNKEEDITSPKFSEYNQEGSKVYAVGL